MAVTKRKAPLKSAVSPRLPTTPSALVDSASFSSKPSNPPSTSRTLPRKIDASDKPIDKLVYELYGLTPEEIAIVEKTR
jgi:hypothetical protein